MPLLFAYDIFVRSGSAHHLLSNSRLIANATAKGYDITTLKDSPIRYLHRGENDIIGEIYDVDQEIIDYLIQIGNKYYPHFSIQQIIVLGSNNQKIPCLYYTLNNN